MRVVDEAVALAEEITSNHFKYSVSQWRRSRYDIRTAGDLQGTELTDSALAQIVRYVGQPQSSALGSARFDFYKVCLQDHVILQALERNPALTFFPLMAYVVTHELVHIVRFSRFLQSFDAYPAHRLEEEGRVHALTGEILRGARVTGIEAIASAFGDPTGGSGFSLDSVAAWS
jgi:hypothetical protein